MSGGNGTNGGGLDIADLRARLDKTKASLGLGDPAESFRRCRSITIDSDELHEELRKAVTNSVGWICVTGEVVEIAATADTLPSSVESMPVLEAELWRESDRVSVHVRHLGAKRWQWVEYESVGDGVDSIVVRHELYEHDAEKRPLRYDVAWELVDDGFGNEVLSPTRCRFVGFGAPTKGKDEREGNQS